MPALQTLNAGLRNKSKKSKGIQCDAQALSTSTAERVSPKIISDL